MFKIDSLGWADGFAFEAFGMRVGIRVQVPEVPAELIDRLPPGWTPVDDPVVKYLYSLWIGGEGPKPGEKRFHIGRVDTIRFIRTQDWGQFLEAFENNLQMLVAELNQEYTFVHAGVVGWQGKAIVIPGRSFTGKSTLVRALLEAGAEYYSDEYAVIDREGRVHPYPRRLALRRAEGGLPDRPTAGELGATTGKAALPVGLVVLSRYQRGGAWNPRKLSRGTAVLEVFDHAVPAEHRPDEVLSLLNQVVPQCAVVKGVRGEAEDTAPRLLKMAA